MNIISPSFEILTPLNRDMLKIIELAGRNCYKSEDKITDDSAGEFVERLNKLKHESVLEHASASVRIICSRAISHQIVRHRIGIGISQESQRFCSYDKDKFGNQITVIRPLWSMNEPINDDNYEISVPYKTWQLAIQQSEKAYFYLLELGLKPQQARGVLPNDCKTELVITLNFRAWKHFFNMRTSSHADPEMRRTIVPLQEEFRKVLPEVFGECE